MIEFIGLVASTLGIIAFFAVKPGDFKTSLNEWFIEPFNSLGKKKIKPGIDVFFKVFKVEDMRLENIFLSNPLSRNSFNSELRSYTAKHPDAIEKLKKEELDGRRLDSEKKGITFDNNASFALRRIDVSRPEGPRSLGGRSFPTDPAVAIGSKNSSGWW